MARIGSTASDACFGAGAHGAARTHRYTLWRRWDERPLMLGVLLNPSTADERVLDPTLKRVKGFAERWGYGGFVIGNAFALRTPKPAVVIARARAAADPAEVVGAENDAHLRALIERFRSTRIVIGWGGNIEHRLLRFRLPGLRALFAGADPVALRVVAGGHPEHPLYIPYSIEPRAYAWPP